MSDPTRAQLQQAYQLIKSGQLAQALEILQPIVLADRNNADAWWLIANASTDPVKQREALETVVRLRPDHQQAQQKLAELKGAETFSFDEPGQYSSPILDDKPKRGTVAVGQPVIVQSKSGTNPLLIILAVIGVVALLVCGGCFFVTSQGVALFGQAISTISNSVTGMPEMFGTLSAITASDKLSNVSNLESKGSIGVGDSHDDTLANSFSNHGYTFSGETGQSITVRVEGSGDLDPEVAVYDPGGSLVAYNDDFAAGRDSQVSLSLTSTGMYTIVVSGFASSGSYTLRVS